MARLLENWFHSYGEWTLERSESPESMIMWAGLFALSSAVKRNVMFPRSLMGSYDIYPNLYIIFVGPPGVVRKSTTAGYAQTLLHSEELRDINIASTAMSASKLIETMSETNDGTITILSSELGTFMNVSQEEMYDVMTDLYDNKDRYEYSTRSHGLEIVEEPCVNFFAATTPGWVNNQMPDYVIKGGFASRCIFLFENQVRQRRLYYHDLNWQKMEDLRVALEHDLKHISEIKGVFKHENFELMQEMEQWYRTHRDFVQADERTENYFERKHVHLHKVMMLLSLCERDDLIITQSHFLAAKAMLEGVEAKMPRAFSAVGRNPYADIILDVLDFINSRSPELVSYKVIRRRFYHNLVEAELDEVLGTLTAMGEVDYVSRDQSSKTIRAYKSKLGKG